MRDDTKSTWLCWPRPALGRGKSQLQLTLSHRLGQQGGVAGEKGPADCSTLSLLAPSASQGQRVGGEAV